MAGDEDSANLTQPETGSWYRTRESREPGAELAQQAGCLKADHLRFRSRLEAAAERIGPYEYLVPQFPNRQSA